jgi:DNA-directed RNA polymerase sigma subunit (sigma70/sigma32)
MSRICEGINKRRGKMTKYELRNYKYICEEMEQIQDQIISLRSKILSPKSQVINGMPRGGSGNGDRIGEVICKINELENMYQDKHLALLSLREDIERVLEPLECKERLLIRYRYIDGMTWGAIADKMNYTVDNVYKLHGKILYKFSKNS